MWASKKPSAACPIPGCWEKTPGGKMCNACRSWWNRLLKYSPKKLEKYLDRLERFAGRQDWRKSRKQHLKLVQGGRR